MQPSAIVFTSETGHTERYAKMLSEKLGIPHYNINEAKKSLKSGTPIIYMGWICASNVKGYGSVRKKYKIAAVVAVGLCDTGTLLEEVRQATKLHPNTPLFTVQGGMDLDKLRGINKFMIKCITSMVDKVPEKTESDLRMLSLLKNGGDYVSEENLSSIIRWAESRNDS